MAVELVGDERVVLGVNDRMDLARVRALAQAQINDRHMRAGVGIVDPAATVIEWMCRWRRHGDRAVHDDQASDADRGGVCDQAVVPE